MASFPTFLATKKFPSRATLQALLCGPLTLLKAAVYAIFIALCTTVFFLLITVNNRSLIVVPAPGGTLTEGMIGAPHYINPLLATTDTDKRLTALVYGNLATLEQNYTVSPDGKIYTVTLQPHLRFDDNKPLTSDDIAFTVEKLQNNTISNTSDYWQQVSVGTPDVNTVVFTLPVADTTFLSRLTFGILPKHIWQNISDQSFEPAKQNLQPVGAGPFKVSHITYQNGIPVTVFLARNNHAAGKKTLLGGLTIATFANQSTLADAVTAGTVDFTYDLSPQTVSADHFDVGITVQSALTNETISVYRSAADTALANSTAIMQMNNIIDKNAIIATVQDGYGTPVGAHANLSANTAIKKITVQGFSLAVENNPSALLAAQTLAQQLQQYGIAVAVKAFDPGTFKNNIAAGRFTLFLAGSNDVTIPQQYSVAIPLYTPAIPYVFNARTHTIISSTLESPETEYADVKDWYTNTDKLWRWIKNKI